MSLVGSLGGCPWGRRYRRRGGRACTRIVFLASGMVVAAGFVSLERATPWVDDEPASVEMSADDGTITLTFQKGDGGAFSATDDTYIRNTAPDTNFGSNLKLLVDVSG